MNEDDNQHVSERPSVTHDHETVGETPDSSSAEVDLADDGDAEAPAEQPSNIVPLKVCSRCSVQSRMAGAFCPNCGNAFDHSRSFRRPSRRLVSIVAGAIIVLGGGTAVIAQTVTHNTEVSAQEVVAKKAKTVAAVEAAKVKAADAARSAADAADAAERAVRAKSVTAVEASITTDAQDRVGKGALDGPILKSSCTPLGGGSTDDLTALTTTFSCIAISVENADGSASGYRFSATMNWDTGSYTWHMGD
jgi:hypothetical protein